MAKYFYQYHEERGEFTASLTDKDGRELWRVRYPDYYEDELTGELMEGSTIFDDGFMKNADDIAGLEKYLKQLGVLQKEDEIVDEEDDLEENDDDDEYSEGGDIQGAGMFAHGGISNEMKIKVRRIADNTIRHWTLKDLLFVINYKPFDEKNKEWLKRHNMSANWKDYDETNWQDGWEKWVEGKYYSLYDVDGKPLNKFGMGGMYAEGGSVESNIKKKLTRAVESSANGMALPYEISVYVPSTEAASQIVNRKEFQRRIDEVQSYLSDLFGGFSSVDVDGGYESSEKGLIQEDVVRVTAFATKKAANEKLDDLINKLSIWAEKWGQESMGLEFEGDLFYVDKRTRLKRGGYMEKGGGFSQYGEPYGFDDSDEADSEYEYHYKEGFKNPHMVWDKIDGVYVADFPSRERAIRWIEMNRTYADGGVVDEKIDTLLNELKKQDIYAYKTKDVSKKPYVSVGTEEEYIDDASIHINKYGRYELIIHYAFDQSEKDKSFKNVEDVVKYLMDNYNLTKLSSIEAIRKSKVASQNKQNEWLSPRERIKKYGYADGGNLRVQSDFNPTPLIFKNIKVGDSIPLPKSDMRLEVSERIEHDDIIDPRYPVSYRIMVDGKDKGLFSLKEINKIFWESLYGDKAAVDYYMYLKSEDTYGMMAKGGRVPKFKVGDMVYSYQNKDYAAPISYTTEISYPNDKIKYKLKLKDGYSNWINEDSLSKSKLADGGMMAKGGSTTRKSGNLPKVQRKVDEVNELIRLGNENDIEIIDNTSTWQAPMRYKPVKYTNGTLYFEWEELDLYKANKGKGKEYVKKTDKVLKRDIESDGMASLNFIARRYRAALKSAGIDKP